jgi:prepilin-type N-terminal cleavage/methylation domain-containing protein
MRNENKNKGLTVVELLVVLAVMALLVSLLLPAVTMVINLAKTTKQKAQFATISIALETFRNDFGDYPESDNLANDYCGAQKLSEAMVGYDLFGVHPNTEFKSDGKWTTGPTPQEYTATDAANLKARKGPYIEVEKAGAVKLDALYSNPSPLTAATYVLTDTFKKKNVQSPDKKFGMPILYYKAKVNKIEHAQGASDNIYDFDNNKALCYTLTAPWDGAPTTVLNDTQFYGDDYIANKNTDNPAASSTYLPYNKDSFILISAGKDGLYGTDDDIFNFDKE